MTVVQKDRITVLGIIAFVLSLMLIFQHAKAATPCIDYSIGSTQYNAASVVQTPTTMTFTGWHLGACGVTPPPPPAAGQILTSAIRYPNTGNSERNNVDLRQLLNIVGHVNATDSTYPFPGANGAVAAVLSFVRAGFICAAFDVPANDRHWGRIGIGSYYGIPGGMDLSYGTSCTSAAIANGETLGVGTGESGPRYTTQRTTSAGAPMSGAYLQPGGRYYWRARFHVPATGSQAVAFTNSYGVVP